MTGNRRFRYARSYNVAASASDISDAKNGMRHLAASAPLRRASEMPSPMNGSTKAAASPTMSTPFSTGSGSRKMSGEVRTGSMRCCHLRARTLRSACRAKTSGRERAMWDRTMAQALTRPSRAPANSTGCTPQ